MITVLLFAQLKEAAGTNQIELDAEEMTVGELKQALIEAYPFNQNDISFVAVNETYAGKEAVVRKGDTVALIPPVSGG
mgnify:CR=1 FL=1